MTRDQFDKKINFQDCFSVGEWIAYHLRYRVKTN